MEEGGAEPEGRPGEEGPGGSHVIEVEPVLGAVMPGGRQEARHKGEIATKKGVGEPDAESESGAGEGEEAMDVVAAEREEVGEKQAEVENPGEDARLAGVEQGDGQLGVGKQEW